MCASIACLVCASRLAAATATILFTPFLSVRRYSPCLVNKAEGSSSLVLVRACNTMLEVSRRAALTFSRAAMRACSVARRHRVLAREPLMLVLRSLMESRGLDRMYMYRNVWSTY